ncbi:MAG: type VII toxin-antitoxin system MntA family adenylyltransferase antitoxin [Myxococcota bacterium]
MLEKLRAALRGRTDVKLALLFGSQATGRAQASSDVDVAVDAPGVDSYALAGELGRATGEEVHLVSLDAAGLPLVEALLRDGVLVHESRRGNAAAWRTRAILAMETDGASYDRMRRAFLARVAARGFGG